MSSPNISNTPPWASLIIVSYNSGDFLQKAVNAIADQTDRDFELIVIDNASTDGSIATLDTSAIDRFRLLQMDQNLGFAKANNIASEAARGEWIGLLNPDTEAFPDWLEAFRAATQAHPSVTMFAGATLNTTDPSLMDGAGDCYHMLGIPWRGGFGRSIAEMPDIGECFSACGASAFIHRRTFLDIGGFDERFFCYCEDVDLGFRFRLQGHISLFWPAAKAYHFGSAITGRVSAFSLHHGTRNRFWVFIKNMPLGGLILILPLHMAVSLYLILRGFMRGHGRPILQGFIDGILGVGPIWGSRKQIHAERKIGLRGLAKIMTFRIKTLSKRRTDVRPL